MRFLFAAIAALGCAACAPRAALSVQPHDSPGRSRAASDEPIDADRPHVGTGTHLVIPGQMQFELGAQFQRFASARTYGSPALVRIGVTHDVEARLSLDGVVGRIEGGTSVSDVGNIQLGTKIRVWGDGEEPWLSILPTLNLGVASPQKGLGSGSNDATLTLLAGRGLGERAHVEANYGLGSIGGGTTGPRFVQHLVTLAVTHETLRTLTTYVEGAWWSRQERKGSVVSFVDFGAIYALNRHMLVDGGAFVGTSSATADYGLFAGLSFVVGRPHPGASTFQPPPTSASSRRDPD
jgi:hypothetical protein